RDPAEVLPDVEHDRDDAGRDGEDDEGNEGALKTRSVGGGHTPSYVGRATLPGVGRASAQRLEQAPTACGAAATRLRARPAVLVHVGVRLTLGTARLACGDACGEQRCEDLGVAAALPAQHPQGRVADVGTVEVGADALAEVIDRVLVQAGIRTYRAGLHAGGDVIDHGSQVRHVCAGRRVALEYRLCCHAGHGTT